MRGTASVTLVYVHPAEAQIENAIEEYLRHRDPFVLDSERENFPVSPLVPQGEGVTEQEL